MQLVFASDGSVTLKTKQETVSLAETVSIGDYKISGAGEYDVTGIQCEGAVTGPSVSYFIWIEDLQFTYLTALNSEVSKLDKANGTHVLIADIRSEDLPEQLTTILKKLEPTYVALFGAGNTEEFRKALGLPLQEGTTHKMTRASLPLEGTILLYS